MRSSSEIRRRREIMIHPTAIVHPDAELGEGVEIGPFVVIDGPVKVGDRTRIRARVTIEGHTVIGADNDIFSGAIIGSVTQDKKYDGGVSYLRIGSGNKIREYVTINPGTKDGTETVIGDHNLLMAYSHVAHDCVMGDHTVLANQGTLAGHVVVENRAIIGGLSAVHQFGRIGQLAIIGGCSKVVQDVPPFMMVDGHPARAYGINSVGMDRAGYSKDDKALMKKAFRIIFKSKLTLKKAMTALRDELPSNPCLEILLDFLQSSERGICR